MSGHKPKLDMSRSRRIHENPEEKRRSEEERQRNFSEDDQKYRKVMAIANFEITSSKKIDQRLKNDRYNQIKVQQELTLLQRREQLAELYNYEMDCWKQEVLSKVETAEDVRNRIRARAYELRDRREQEKQKFVEERLTKQFQDSQDDTRTLHSKKLTVVVKQEVLAQIQEKLLRKQRLTLEEEKSVMVWKQQLDEIEEAQRDKEASRTEKQAKQMQALKNQISEIEERRELDKFRDRLADEAEIRDCRAALAREEEDQRRRAEEAREQGMEILRLNAGIRAATMAEKKLQRQQDQALLQYALAKEKESQVAEVEKRQANIEAAANYREYLKEATAKKAEDSGRVDQMRQAEENKVLKARDDALQAREEARATLMKNVDRGRQEQQQAKQQALLAEKAQEQALSNRMLEDAKRAVEQERAAALARRMQMEENQKALADQIKMREDREIQAKQEAYLAEKIRMRQEQMQKQRLGGSNRY